MPQKREESRVRAMERIQCWFSEWRRHRALLRELQACGDDGSRILEELRLSPADFRKLAASRSEDATLLPRMMQALHIDPDRVARAEPAVMRDLHRVCCWCGSKGRCWQDLERGEAAANLKSYCANATTLEALRDNRISAAPFSKPDP